jgi:hypothetical protein
MLLQRVLQLQSRHVIRDTNFQVSDRNVQRYYCGVFCISVGSKSVSECETNAVILPNVYRKEIKDRLLRSTLLGMTVCATVPMGCADMQVRYLWRVRY